MKDLDAGVEGDTDQMFRCYKANTLIEIRNLIQNNERLSHWALINMMIFNKYEYIVFHTGLYVGLHIGQL